MEQSGLFLPGVQAAPPFYTVHTRSSARLQLHGFFSSFLGFTSLPPPISSHVAFTLYQCMPHRDRDFLPRPIWPINKTVLSIVKNPGLYRGMPYVY